MINIKYIVQVYDVSVTEPPFKFKILGELEISMSKYDYLGEEVSILVGIELKRKFCRRLHFLSMNKKGERVVVACLTEEEYSDCIEGHYGCKCNARSLRS